MNAIVELLFYLNNGFQLLGVILTGFRTTLVFENCPNMSREHSYYPGKDKYIAVEAMISFILLTLSFILAITANKILTEAEAGRKNISLVLLNISQLLIGIVIIFNIAVAVFNYQRNLYPSEYFYVLNISTISYYIIIVAMFQSLLLSALKRMKC